MTDSSDIFNQIYSQLCPLLRKHSTKLVLISDDDNTLYYNTHHVMKNGKPLYFGSVQIKKNYVSFHLMPVYVFPELLDNISPALRKRMQGKSCFNFSKSDEQLFSELDTLTSSGLTAYENANYI